MMILPTKRFKCIGLAVFFVAIVAGCNNHQAVPPGGSTPAKPVAPPKLQGAAPVVEVPAPPKWVYLSEGRRDPFQPFILVKRAIDIKDGEIHPVTPLQQYESQQYKLNAIIIGYGEPLAMVLAPDGKSYVIRKGNKIGKNGGKVVAITPGSIVVEEKFSDVNDKIVTDNIEIKLPKREGV